MIIAPRPKHDKDRLADLYSLEILDTPDEERFDRIVRLASMACGTPIAYISLVDENRQWLKASCGLTTRQTGRDESFCGHAVAGDGPLIIPNALEDERFRDNPLVLGEPYVRFYAGFPLQGPKGHNVGTLCLVDREPREIGDDDMAKMLELASMAERELNLIELVRAQKKLIETQKDLVSAQEMMAQELADAEGYMRSLLPEPLDAGQESVRAEHKLVFASSLGGDMLGYRWFDDDHLAIWVLDVCGHGIGSSLLSITANDAVSSMPRLKMPYTCPGTVLQNLSRAFPMEDHQYKFFTMWFGVYKPSTRKLRYASAGHPPALIVEPGKLPRELAIDAGLVVGAMEDADYTVVEQVVPPGSRLYVFTDGVFEVPERDQIGLDGFAALVGEKQGVASRVEAVYEAICGLNGCADLADDFTLLEMEFF